MTHLFPPVLSGPGGVNLTYKTKPSSRQLHTSTVHVTFFITPSPLLDEISPPDSVLFLSRYVRLPDRQVLFLVVYVHGTPVSLRNSVPLSSRYLNLSVLPRSSTVHDNRWSFSDPKKDSRPSSFGHKLLTTSPTTDRPLLSQPTIFVPLGNPPTTSGGPVRTD